MHRNRHIAASVLTLGLWFPAWKALQHSHSATSAHEQHHWQTIAAGWMAFMCVVVGSAAAMMAILMTADDVSQASKLSVKGVDRVAEAAPVDAGPQTYSDDLVMASSSYEIVENVESPLPAGSYDMQALVAKGTDVPYVAIAESCAVSVARASAGDVDGGMCTVFHNVTSFEMRDYTKAQISAGLTEINLLSNLCYTIVAWKPKDGDVVHLDLRDGGAAGAGSSGWEGYDCEALPAGGTA